MVQAFLRQNFLEGESGRIKFWVGDDFVENVVIFDFFHTIGVVSIVLWWVYGLVGNRVWILIGGLTCLFCQVHEFLWS